MIKSLIKSKKNYNKISLLNQKAILEVIVILIFTALLSVGLIYLKYSSQTIDNILLQTHKIKARNLAYAAFQKALLVLKNQYAKGYIPWLYPEQQVTRSDEMERNLGDGYYKVVRVELVKSLVTPYETITKNFFNVPYVINDKEYGSYDVYKITTLGVIPNTKTKVKLTSLVKVIREKSRY